MSRVMTTCRVCRTDIPNYLPAHPGICSVCYGAPYGGRWTKKSRRLRRAIRHCQACGATAGPFEVDHVEPGTERGGLMVLCRSCHHRKTATGET